MKWLPFLNNGNETNGKEAKPKEKTEHELFIEKFEARNELSKSGIRDAREELRKALEAHEKKQAEEKAI